MQTTFRLGLVMTLLLLGAACGGSNSNLQAAPMPEGGDYSGVYFSPQYGEMHLVQNGASVHGRYTKEERTGTIQGEADGNLLRFEWKEEKAMISNRPQTTVGHGYFHYLVDPASGDHVLKGRWGLDEDETTGGEWNAYKSRSREPDLESIGGGSGSGGESLDDDGDSGGDDLFDDEGDSGGDSGGGDDDELF